MVESYYKKQNLRPYLLTSGILFLISGIIHLHYAIARAIVLGEITGELILQEPQLDSIPSYPYAEHVVGLVFLFLGFASLIAILTLLSRVFDNEVRQSNVAIVFLTIFVLFQIVKEFYAVLIPFTRLWFNIGFLLVYAIFRGIALMQVKKQLNVPINRFGEGFLGVYAWSFLFTQFVIFILTIVGATSASAVIVTNTEIVELWMNQNQIFLDTVAISAIGLKFIIDGIKNPIIESKIHPRTAPDVDTRVELGMGQYKRKGMKRPAILDQFPLEDEED